MCGLMRFYCLLPCGQHDIVDAPLSEARKIRRELISRGWQVYHRVAV